MEASGEGEILRRSPLDEAHRALGAKMGVFGGWLMPIEYAGTLAEHDAVRSAVGVFDVSHLGKVSVGGDEALDALQMSLTSDVARVPVGGAQYGLALDDDGGIVDDLIVYRLGRDDYLVVPNAANAERVLAQISSHAPADVELALRDDLALLAVQGPRSLELVEPLFPQASPLAYMSCDRSSWVGGPVVVARSGYTGERGYELFVDIASAEDLWDRLLRDGEPLAIRPCGLGARDTLRLEMGYPLHGNDISEDRTPLEAGLGWAVAMDKGEFPGREALEAQRSEGIPSRLVGLRMTDRLIPRSHYAVYAAEEPVGEVTSGTFSPTLRSGIALAYVERRDDLLPGATVEVDVRGRRGAARIVDPPFVDRSPR
ncbi:MAG TPA: glycine cleavage system aminomethyltransferase GcvT [Actinomycetota bacterium]|nr:glycine cleavage system aminomethyltransferase GcvT [Actinomycetota bacterium]